MRSTFLVLTLTLLFIYCSSKPADNTEDENVEECNAKKKCKQPMVCRGGQCVCKDDYTTDENGKCIKAPTVGELCMTKDDVVLDCKGIGVSASCPSEGPTKNKCQCISGYEPIGKVCRFKDQNLNEKCESDADNGVAFSTCKDRKVVCSEGFKAENGQCLPEVLKCPGGGDPLKDGKRTKQCEVKYRIRAYSDKAKRRSTVRPDGKDPKQDKSSSKENADGDHDVSDSCPSSHFCFYHPLIRSLSNSFLGYCCPKAAQNGKQADEPVCPLGTALKVDQCAPDMEFDGSDDKASKGSDGRATASICPSLTHTCIFAANATVCCPVPCPGQLSFFASNGRCIEVVPPGSPCKNDIQCGRSAVCKEAEKGKKVCTCKPDFVLTEGFCEPLTKIDT